MLINGKKNSKSQNLSNHGVENDVAMSICDILKVTVQFETKGNGQNEIVSQQKQQQQIIYFHNLQL